MSPENPDSGETSAEATPPARLRGLWELMPAATAPVPEPARLLPDHEPGDVPTNLDPPSGPRKSLWAVMGQSDAAAIPSAGDNSAESEHLVDAAAAYTTGLEFEVPVLAVDLTARAFVRPLDGSVVSRRPAVALDFWACLCGGLSVPLSLCAIWPGLLGSLPSAGCAFVAIILSLLVWTAGRIGQRARWRSVAGAVAAILSLCLGPLVFAPLGNTLRGRQSVQATQQHLETIGRGLAAHLAEHDYYPVGGTQITLPNGQRRGGHGWMTFLLPYVNQPELYQTIVLTEPYDAPVNRPALGTEVADYYASGGDRRKIAGGFAVSHFAGVGGSITSVRGEEVPAGIFDARRPVRQRDLVDGAANTWIVGEVPGGYAPWGDPENWRTVTKGLNKDTRGFGNTAGTGAMALMADGRVKFFSNQTDVDLLKRLSTRDAQDHESPR